MINTLLKFIVPYILGQKQRQQVLDLPYRVLNEKDIALINLKKKDGAVVVILGTRDTGKTELAYRFAQFLGKPTYAVSPQQKPPSWINWIKLDEIETIQSQSTLICDDLPSYASNRDYNEALVKTLEKIIPMVRHKKTHDFPVGETHLIFCSQSSAQADKYILDCDMAFFKPLGLLYEDLERPNIRKIYKNDVDQYFEGKNDFWIVRHAVMWSRTYKGLITVSKSRS